MPINARALIHALFCACPVWLPSQVAAAAQTRCVGNASPALAACASDFGVVDLVAAITAVGALGGAACGLVDTSRRFRGVISKAGLGVLYAAMGYFAPALNHALGVDQRGEPHWREVVRVHWIHGRPRAEQKALVKSLIRLGLVAKNAPDIAHAGRVSAEKLSAAASKIEAGGELEDADVNVLVRLDASVDARLDAAFDHALQRYHQVSRASAMLLAIAISLTSALALGWGPERLPLALVMGALAVPFASLTTDRATHTTPT